MDVFYSIDLATPAQLAVIQQVELRAASRFGDAVPLAVRSSVTPLATLAAGQREGLLWVATAGDEHPVGFALAGRFDERRAHLVELDVVPEHGRRGLGRALVAAVEDWASAAGYGELILTTYRDFPWNADFYRSLGFSPVSPHDFDEKLTALVRSESELGLEPPARVVMCKRLVAV